MHKALRIVGLITIVSLFTACSFQGPDNAGGFDKEQALLLAFDDPEIAAARDYIEASGEKLEVDEAILQNLVDPTATSEDIVHKQFELILDSSKSTYQLGIVFDSTEQVFESYLIETSRLGSGNFESTYINITSGEMSTTIYDAEASILKEGGVLAFKGFEALNRNSLSLSSQGGEVLDLQTRLENLSSKYNLLPPGPCGFPGGPNQCPEEPDEEPEEPDEEPECNGEKDRVSAKRSAYDRARADRDAADRQAGEDNLDLLEAEESVRRARQARNTAQLAVNINCAISIFPACESAKQNLEVAKQDLARAEDREDQANDDYQASSIALSRAQAEVNITKNELDDAEDDLSDCRNN